MDDSKVQKWTVMYETGQKRNQSGRLTNVESLQTKQLVIPKGSKSMGLNFKNYGPKGSNGTVFGHESGRSSFFILGHRMILLLIRIFGLITVNFPTKNRFLIPVPDDNF